MPDDETVATLRRDINKLARAVGALQRDAKAARRQPERQFAQVEAVATVTARILHIMQVPRALTEPRMEALMAAEDRQAMERAAAGLLSDLSALQAAMQARAAELPPD